MTELNQKLKQFKKLSVEILTDKASLVSYSYDNSSYQKPPIAVCLPENNQQVQQIIHFCFEHSLSICPRGKGTATTAGAIPTNQSSVVISSEKMDKILDFDPMSQSITVQTGVSNIQVQNLCQTKNLFWPPDPSSMNICSIGGNLACNASGPRALFYGSSRENVLSIKAIDGKGEIFETGFKCTKYSAGYDLTRLLIGSEGTLAFITEATLKLSPIPKNVSLIQIELKNSDDLAYVIAALRNSPFLVQSIEMMDRNCLNLIQDKHPIDEDSSILLMVELINFDTQKYADVFKNKILQSLNNKECLLNLVFTTSEQEKQKLKQIRKDLSPAIKAIAPNRINEDIVIPIVHLGEFLVNMDHLAKKYDLPIVNFGHAGNGNVHCNVMYNKKDQTQLDKAKKIVGCIMQLVNQYQGAISGEHGIGLAKREFIHHCLEPKNIELMKAIKVQFDPKNILNPGKIF